MSRAASVAATPSGRSTTWRWVKRTTRTRSRSILVVSSGRVVRCRRVQSRGTQERAGTVTSSTAAPPPRRFHAADVAAMADRLLAQAQRAQLVVAHDAVL